MRKLTKILLFLFVASVLAACSSGGGSEDPPPPDPIVNAGGDRFVDPGANVDLDGSSSSHEDTSVTITAYSWIQLSGSAVTLNNADTATPSFTAPNVAVTEELNFQLTVSYSNGDQASDTVRITVIVTPPNQDPVANGGGNQTVNTGDSVTLDGSASSDPDAGDSISSYAWVQTGGPNVTLQNANTAVASFTAPVVASNTELTFQLTVEDTNGAQNTDTVSVTVSPVVSPPSGAYVPFVTYDDTSTAVGLSVVNTETPHSVTLVETGIVDQVITFSQYDFDIATQVVSNQRLAYVFYWKDNHFWRVSLAAGSDLTPQQVSSETVTEVCQDVQAPNDQLDPLDTFIMIETAGVDGNCFSFPNDNEIKVMRLGYNATDAAMNATGLFRNIFQVEVLDNGFLSVNTSDEVTFYDVNLANPVNLLTASNPDFVNFESADNGNAFVFVDNEVRLINGTTRTITVNLQATASMSPEIFECDALNCYFFDEQMDSSFNIYGLPKNGSSSATELTTGFTHSGDSLDILTTTTNYLFFKSGSNTGTDEVFRFPKAPVGGDTVLSVDSADDIAFILTSANNVYYEKRTLGAGGLILPDASIAVMNNESLLNEQSFVNSSWMGTTDFSYSLTTYIPNGTIFLANNATDISVSGLAGATLEEYNFSDGAFSATVGEIPAGVAYFLLFATPRYGDVLVGRANMTADNFFSEIFVVDPTSANVFTNVTNTPTFAEDLIVQ